MKPTFSLEGNYDAADTTAHLYFACYLQASLPFGEADTPPANSLSPTPRDTQRRRLEESPHGRV